jgi:hypothetical protein
MLGSSQEAQDALPNIMKIRRPLREAFIFNLFQFQGTALN